MPNDPYHKRGLVWPVVAGAFLHFQQLFQSASYRKLQQWAILRRSTSRYKPGTVYFKGQPIHYIDIESFLYTWDSIMVTGIYDIGDAVDPFLIDAGANIGLAQFYWKLRYQKFSSICFEPDAAAFAALQQNLQAWACATTVYPVALGGEDGEASFVEAGGDAGHVAQKDEATTRKVPVRRLSSYLDRPVDLLKIDIEGAEFEVLLESRNNLDLVKRIFVECHDRWGQPQRYAEILDLLSQAGYRCYTAAEQGSRTPFSEIHLTSDRFDQTSNIYAVREPYLRLGGRLS